MIKKVVNIKSLLDHKANSTSEDLSYWLSKSPEERIAAVDFLRKQHHGITNRLQRSARVIK